MSSGAVPEPADVVVIGGGPGGSTVAAVLARSGLSVLLLEREHFPREHIGESLLPATMPILEEIGALPAVEATGFLPKWGATMVWGTDPEPWAWFFKETNRRWPHSFQVTRPEFDQILLDNARRHGADVREGHRVVEVLFEGDRATGVRYASEAGEGTVHAEFVVDASGQQALIGRALGLRRWDDFFRNLAVYGYFQGGERLQPPEENNIFIESFEHGWSWLIPMHTGVASVGVVVDSEMAQGELRERSVRDFYFQQLGQAARTAAMLESAELISELQVVKDWSYASDEVVGDGYILVGDAACFVDPLFSSGVHLAMSSALLAAAYIQSARKDPALGEAARPVYKELYYTQYRHFHEMAKLFYSSNHTVDSYFWEARRITGEEAGETPRQSFIRAVAGQPPQGYERAVIEHGDAPAAFTEEVRAVEAERSERRAHVDSLADELIDLVPVLAPDVAIEVKPVLERGEFGWGYVIDSDARPGGTPVSTLVAELLRRLDGTTTARAAIDDLRATYGPRIDATAEAAALQALAVLYVDGVVDRLVRASAMSDQAQG